MRSGRHLELGSVQGSVSVRVEVVERRVEGFGFALQNGKGHRRGSEAERGESWEGKGCAYTLRSAANLENIAMGPLSPVVKRKTLGGERGASG
jgi:hypothetical protein